MCRTSLRCPEEKGAATRGVVKSVETRVRGAYLPLYLPVCCTTLRGPAEEGRVHPGRREAC